jgi:short-subunit dehydrogenase
VAHRVETPMTSVNKFSMPFIVSSEDAARRIIRGLEKWKFEIVFPWQLVALMKLGRLMPNRMFFWYARAFLAPPRKKH